MRKPSINFTWDVSPVASGPYDHKYSLDKMEAKYSSDFFKIHPIRLPTIITLTGDEKL